MEIEFSHLLLLLLFVGLPMTYRVLPSVCCCNAWPTAALLPLINRHSCHGNTHAWGASTVVSSRIMTGNSNLVAIANLYLRRLTREAPVLVVMFKRLERMQWKRST